jgi:hypothetical protein
MESVAKRKCANGERCYHVRKLGLTEPVTLRLGQVGEVCDKCSEEAATGLEAPPEHAELFRFARLLFNAGVEDEDQIIPTLVFAANLSEMSHLRELRDSVAALDDQDENWNDLRGQFSYFFDKMVSLPETIDGVPILRLQPFTMTSVTNEQGYVEEVAIDVFMRSVQAEKKMVRAYEWLLERYDTEIDPNRGDISYKVHEDFIRIVARPETMSVDAADGRVLALRSGPPRLPDPLIVAGMYRVLKGSQSPGMFEGFRSVLAGRERGKPGGADILVPACVGWYVAGRGDLSGQTEERRRVVRILNQELLGPCGKEHQGESSSRFWRDVRKVSDAIRSLERALHRRARDTWTS